ncbi:hypothetical protein CCR75_002485 [Bremia lactucae]|uniref:Uncharacterized protein n=1 Tax=Bremia lactucae TaxID=4779 RepID=A0A976FRZ8_BRELC|nr:hypothetical protein CCR75_002485 [Bremia lactucae]
MAVSSDQSKPRELCNIQSQVVALILWVWTQFASQRNYSIDDRFKQRLDLSRHIAAKLCAPDVLKLVRERNQLVGETGITTLFGLRSVLKVL